MFIMKRGGTIVGAQARGVPVESNGTFTIQGGTIVGNSASYDGGGVYMNGTFTMGVS
jgi:predicted outer membrane repeat protein